MTDMEKSETREVVDGVANLAISRGIEPEYTIDFKSIENIEVFDEDGKTFRFGNIYKTKKTILVLIRHFLCYICKEYVDDLADIPEKNFEKADVQLVVIGCSPHKFIKPFRKATGYNYDIYVDPERVLYKALNCSVGFGKTDIKQSKHVKSGMVSGILQSMVRGMKHCKMQGNIDQQGGSFILGPGDNVSYVHLDKSSTDHTPINDLLIMAGVEPVNFAKDTRVMDV